MKNVFISLLILSVGIYCVRAQGLKINSDRTFYGSTNTPLIDTPRYYRYPVYREMDYSVNMDTLVSLLDELGKKKDFDEAVILRSIAIRVIRRMQQKSTVDSVLIPKTKK